MLVEASSIGGASPRHDEPRCDWVWSESRAQQAARITGSGDRPARILMVEDNPGDVVLTSKCLAKTGLRHKLVVATDGDAALAFLRRQGEHEAAPRPDLVLLDLDLPRRGGLEVLAEIKADPQLRRLPVVVLTSSDDLEEIRASYRLHANCFITKPTDLYGYALVVEGIVGFWLQVARLPR